MRNRGSMVALPGLVNIASLVIAATCVHLCAVDPSPVAQQAAYHRSADSRQANDQDLQRLGSCAMSNFKLSHLVAVGMWQVDAQLRQAPFLELLQIIPAGTERLW